MTQGIPAREPEMGPKPPLGLRFLPSLTDLTFLYPALIVIFFRDGLSSMLEGDTGWHIRTGEWILANGRVPRQDIFSFTRPGEVWYAWEWLWDLVFAWLHAQGGLTTVTIASLGVLCVTFTIVFRLAARKSGSPMIAFVVTWAALTASSLHWLARPHLFTLLFTAVFYSILERVSQGRTRLLWLLPPLTVLWTNLHGGFLVGLVLIGAYALGELLRAALLPDTEERRRSLLGSRPYVLAGLGCGLASLVNPYGYGLHVHIYRYLSDPNLWKGIVEFLAFDFQHPAGRYVEPMMLIAIVAALWAAHRRRFEYSLLLLFWAHAGLYSVRNIPIFVLLATPLVAEVLAHGLDQLQRANLASWVGRLVAGGREPVREFEALERTPRFHAVSAALALLLLLVAFSPSASQRFRARFDPAHYPVKATAELRELVLGSRIFTSDEWGDYLIYRNYPAGRVFIDGRSDFYGARFGNSYKDIVNVSYEWEKNLNQQRVDFVLLSPKFALVGALKESSRWRVVYDDGIAIAFQRPDSRSALGKQVSGEEVCTGENRGRAAAQQLHRGS